MIAPQRFDWRRGEDGKIWFGYRINEDGTERCIGLVLDRGAQGTSSRLNRVDKPKHHKNLADAKARIEKEYI
jgi:hypothetical protein